MKTAFIIHGAYGNPQENWFPWLKKELEKKDYEVFVPQFPTPENQNLSSWREVFSEFLSKVNEESIFIGHSVGPAFLLDIIENLDFSIHASFFVAPFVGLLNNSEIDKINQTITDKNFHWNTILKNCKLFHIYYSDNDPYVPMSKSEFLGGKLQASMEIIQNGGHMNEQSGFLKFETLLKDILK